MRLRKYLFYKKFGLVEPTMPSCWRNLCQANAMSAEALAQENWKKRLRLVRFCAEEIPFYKRRFQQAGFEVGDLKTEEDFQRLPILEKQEIRDCTQEMVHPDFDPGKLTVETTGGSTGRPLKTYNDPRVHQSSMSWRMLNWWGVDPSDNSAYLYRKIPEGLRKLAIDCLLYPTRRTYLSAAEMSDNNMESFYRRLLKLRPKYLVGYVGAIDEFAKFLIKNSYTLPGILAIWTTASPLTQAQRELYESTFGCAVYTQYGCCELYWIAAECKCKNGLHVGSDIRHVDIVEGNNPVGHGQFGDIVVTDLLNFAFPLLRYRVGDRGRLLEKKCECGLPFPLMDYVKGRISDAIHLPDGTIVPGEYWTTIFDDFTDMIEAFQVRQRSDFSLEIRYQLKAEVDGRTAVNEVDQRLNRKLRGKVEIEFKEEAIAANDNGKFRFVVSELAQSSKGKQET